MSKVHDLINYERKRRGIPTVYWSREMARLAQSQANYCAKVGRLVHSRRFAFQGGENLAEGGSNFSPRAIVDCWLNSKAGHREYLLNPRVKKAGVGIAKSKGKTFVAWAFSEEPPSYPDCPHYKPPRPRTQKPKRGGAWPRQIRIGPGTRTFLMSIAKLSLCLLVIAGIGIIAWTGYRLFTHQITPVIGTIVFLAEIGLLIWIISVLRSSRFRWRKPSFKIIFWSLLIIALVCAFAGIEPMSSTKERVVSFVQQGWERITAPSRSLTLAPAKPTPEPVKPKPSTEVSYTNEEVEELIYVLINNERRKFGMTALEKDPLLTSLAREHSASMVKHQFFSHDRATDQRPFSYGQPPGTIRGENISKTPVRKLVPGPYLTLEEVCEWVVSGWMSSAGHRGNILEPRFTKTGVGVSRLGEYLYITQMFEGAY